MEPKEKKAFEPSGLVPRSIVRTFERFRQQLLPGSETAAIREYRISRYQVLVSARCLFTLLIIPIATNWLVSSWLLSPLVEHFWNTQQNEIFLNSYQEERAFAELESFSEKLFFESLLNTTNTINVELANPHISFPDKSSHTLTPLGYAKSNTNLRFSLPQRGKRVESLNPLQVAEPTRTLPDKSSFSVTFTPLGYGGLRLEDLYLGGVRVEFYKDKSSTLRYRHIPLQRILALPQTGMRGRGNASTIAISSNWEKKASLFSASDLFAHTLHYSLPLRNPLQVAELTPSGLRLEDLAYPKGVSVWGYPKGNAMCGLASTGVANPFGVCPHISFPDKSDTNLRFVKSLNPLQVQIFTNRRSLTPHTQAKSSDKSSILNPEGVSSATCMGSASLPDLSEDLSGNEMCGQTPKGLATCKVLRASSVLSVPLESTYDNSLKIKEKVQNKILELALYYNQQTIISITNIVGDVVSLVTLGCLFIWMKPEITILKSFLIEAIYSLSDTTKSFLLILLTDLLVGFHSPRGWETALELLLKHFGLPENQDFVFLFVATFPVLLDTVFKYWIFRHLNKISPSTVATYHSMIE